MSRVASNHRNPPRAALVTALGALISCIVLLTACASTPPPPNAQLAVSKAAVEHAAGSAADAPLPLAAARDKLARANTAYAAQDYALAQQLAEQAEADATLAGAQARSVRSQRALTEVHEGLRQLREEIARK